MDTTSAGEVEELSPSDCWALLRERPVGRIALQDGEEIEIFPVNFIVDGGTIVFRTAHGTKLRLIGTGARCTFEADAIDSVDQLVWSVVLKGVAKPVAGHDAMIASFDVKVSTWQAGSKPTYVRLTPQSVSGRRFLAITG